METLRVKPQVRLWSEDQRNRVETRTVGHVTRDLRLLTMRLDDAAEGTKRMPWRRRQDPGMPGSIGGDSQGKPDSSHLVQGPVNRGRDQDSPAHDGANNKNAMYAPDSIGGDSEGKTANSPLVQGSAKQSRDQDSQARQCQQQQ